MPPLVYLPAFVVGKDPVMSKWEITGLPMDFGIIGSTQRVYRVWCVCVRLHASIELKRSLALASFLCIICIS